AVGRELFLCRRPTRRAACLGHPDAARLRHLPRQRFRSLSQSYGRRPQLFRIRNQRPQYRLGSVSSEAVPRRRQGRQHLGDPWTAFTTRTAVTRPVPGAEWRVNFSRVEWRTTIENGKYVKVPGQAEDNWVWSAQGAINMHVPDRWGFVKFVER